MEPKRGRGECINFKLLGDCRQRDECPYSHRNQERFGRTYKASKGNSVTGQSRLLYKILCRTVRKSVDIPQKSVPMVLATKGEFLRLLRGICECILKVTSSTSVSLSSFWFKLLPITKQ